MRLYASQITRGVLSVREKLCLRLFAQFKNPAQVRAAYQEKFGEQPSDIMMLRCNVGALNHRNMNPDVSADPRMKYFKKQRLAWRSYIKENCAIGLPEVRLWNLGQLFEIELERVKNGASTSRALAILESAAKESASYYSKTPQVSIDARSINVMPNEDLDKRIKELVGVFGVHLTESKQIEAEPALEPPAEDEQEVPQADSEESYQEL